MIPKTFKLANRTWTVRYLPKSKMDGDHGSTDPIVATITLSDELFGEYLLHTFEHELQHAIWFAYGKTDHCEVEIEGLSALRRQFELTKK